MSITNNISKRILTVVISICMIIGLCGIQAHATTVTTSTYNTSSGHTVYVRKSGSTDELGQMYINRTSTGVSNTFTASVGCNTTAVYVSTSASGFIGKQVSSLKPKKTVTVYVSASNPDKAYGYCSVSY
jgi:hypothetical protein